MNIRNLCAHIVSTMLSMSAVAGFLGLGMNSVLAQSVTATTPFPFCVNNHAYPKGRYEFTHVSPSFLSIRDMKGGGRSFFLIGPEDRAQSLAPGRVRSAPGVTFHTFQGFKELQTFDDPDSGLTFELVGQGILRDKLKTHGSLEPINCFNEKSSNRGRTTTGR